MLNKRKISTFVCHDDGAHSLTSMICPDDNGNSQGECVPKLACGITNALLRELETRGTLQIHLRGHTDSRDISSMEIKVVWK